MRIFVAHNSADAKYASELTKTLRRIAPSASVELSIDRDHDEHGGEDWRTWIVRTIENSDLVVLVASDASAKAPWVCAEMGAARAAAVPVLPVRVTPGAQVNPVAATIHGAHVADPTDAARIGPLVTKFLAIGDTTPKTGPIDPRLAYPGFRPFVADDEQFFHGRTDRRDEIRNLLTDGHGTAPLIVVGPSGSGKSSLVAAGVLPFVRRQGLTVSGPHRAEELVDPIFSWEIGGRDDPDPSILVVDQAEELRSLSREQLELLADRFAHIRNHNVRLVLVVRVEFREVLSGLVHEPIDVYLPYIETASLEAVIREPAKIANIKVEDALVNELVDQTRDGSALPLLAFTLSELAKALDPVSRSLDLATLRSKELSVRRVLEDRAAFAMNRARSDGSLALTENEILEALSRLADPDVRGDADVRLPQPAASFSTRERAALDVFAEEGLITYRSNLSKASSGAEDEVHLVDVAHESLFQWQDLAEFVQKHRSRNANRISIVRAASEWERAKTDSKANPQDFLLSGARLAGASELDDATAEQLAAFLEASRQADERQQRIRRLQLWTRGLLVAVAIALFFVGVFAWNSRQAERNAEMQRELADEQRELAVAAKESAEEARELEATARQRAEQAELVAVSNRTAASANEQIATDRQLSMLLGAAGAALHPSPESRGALLNSLAVPDGPTRFLEGGDGVDLSLSVALDAGRILLIDGREPAILVVASGELFPLERELEMEIIGLEVAADSPLAVAFGRLPPSTAVLVIFDHSTGQIVRTIEHDAPVLAAAVSDSAVYFGDVEGEVHASTTGRPTPTFVYRHPNPVISLAWSDGLSMLASTSRSGLVVHHREGDEWDSEVLRERRLEGGAAEQVIAVGDAFVGSGTDPGIWLWSPNDANELSGRFLGESRGTVSAMAHDAGLNVVYTGNEEGIIQRWSMTTGGSAGQDLQAHDRRVVALSVPDTGRLLSTQRGDIGLPGRAVLWNLEDRRRVEVLRHDFGSLAETPLETLVQGGAEPRAIAVAGELLDRSGTRMETPIGTRRAWSVANDGLVVEVGSTQIDQPPATFIHFERDGSEHVLAENVDAGDVADCFAATIHDSEIRLLPLDPNCGPESRSWGLPDWDESRTVVRISPTNDRLLIAGNDRLLVLSLPDLILEFEEDLPSAVAPTGAHWVSATDLVVGFDVGGGMHRLSFETDREWIQLLGHDDAVWFFANSDELLFSGGQDGFLVVTDLATSRLVGAPLIGNRRQHTNDRDAFIRGLRWEDELQALLAVHGHDMVAWNLDFDDLADQACEAADRVLTHEELSILSLPDDSRFCS